MVADPALLRAGALQRDFSRHSWLHFTRMKGMIDSGAPIIDRGEGCYLWDINGKRYFDGLSGLFTVQIGYGREELADVAAQQMKRLSYASHFGYGNGPSIDLAARIAELAPGSLNRVFFSASGSEAVETALKMARQYHKLRGFSGRYKTISRKLAYHGTSFGALSVNGVTALRAPFEPLVPGARHVNNTNCYRCPSRGAEGGCCMRCLTEIEDTILFEGPETVSAVVIEPVQNSGGCFTPPPGYMEGVRSICDRYGILFISDEVICAFGRLGTMFGHEKYGYVPDIVTMAKGLSSGYQPIGGCLVRDEVADTFMDSPTRSFTHGITFGGHPVAAAVALKNLEIMTDERVVENVAANEGYFRDLLESLMSRHDCIGDVRGAGYFMAMELVKDKSTKESFTDQESEDLLRNVVSARLQEEGLICRAEDKGEPVIQLSPPLIATREQLADIADILDRVLSDVDRRLRQRTPLRAVPPSSSVASNGAMA
ncbi:MAG: aminotransferase class-III [Chloroflexi bacterium]|jgi:adenosylmethionine-8-amino-7-oxononanoate aminotransferase|nr:aminotransferase class-III [Chloroflexota bacterium]